MGNKVGHQEVNPVAKLRDAFHLTRMLPWRAKVQPYLTQSVFKVVLQKSSPTQIRQHILDISKSKG